MRFAILATVLALAPFDAGAPAVAPAARFDGTRLLLPTGYDVWPLVGASLGLSYTDRADSGPGTFHRVYINPSSYEAYRRTRQFPEGTVFVLESYEAQERKSIAKGGWVEGARTGVDASVKDSTRYAGGWAYFNFDNGAAAAATAFPDDRCHSCHKAHGDVDSVFVQFYPNLRK